MILFPHMLVGATIGYRVKNFWAIFAIAIFLHFLFDRIPHWEYTGKIKIKTVSTRELYSLLFKALFDLAIGASIIWVILRDSAYWSYILFGAFISIVPDGIVFLHFLMRAVLNREFSILKRFYDFHENNHIPDDNNCSTWGLTTQSLIIILSIYLIS